MNFTDIKVCDLKNNDIIVINNHLCRITDIAQAPPNKRMIAGVDIMTGDFNEIIYLSSSIISCFVHDKRLK